MTFNIKTLGCKVNTYESEYIYSLFIEKGFSYVENKADIYVINTCTVTNMSDRKSRQVIHTTRNNNPNSIIIICGCFCESANMSNKLDLVDADIIIGNKDKSKILDYLEEYLRNKKKIVKFYSLKNTNFEDMEIKYTNNRTRAFVKIQDGCNNFCTYCIIPYVRGNIRSKEHNKVIEEITLLVNNGYKEVVLTGIHTGSYNDNGYVFKDLLKDLVNIKGLLRLRISSIEVNELTDEVLDVFKSSSVLVPHLHIPLQSGSNEILKLMNRKYNKEYFIDRINYIRSIKPDISITTDVIVGFPNETEELHNESMNTIKTIGFTKIHTFPYSDRYGTVASKMNNKVDGNIKKERVSELLSISNKLEKDYYSRFINKELPVLFEEVKDNYIYGHTPNFIKVKYPNIYNTNKIYNLVIKEENICLN